MTESSEQPNSSVDRRTAMKIGVGATIGAAIWAEPTVRGLARRPAYAQAGSGTDFDVDTSLNPGGEYFDGILEIDRSNGNSNVYTFDCGPGTTVTLNLTIGGTVRTDSGPNPLVITQGPNGNQPVVGTVTCT